VAFLVYIPFDPQFVTSSGEVSEVRDLVGFWELKIGGQATEHDHE
jgi:hypothetical protein